jgi:hypothetical protein
MYDSATGKRVEETVEHPETRSKEEIRQARQANQPRQPSGRPAEPVNQFERTIEVELARHSHVWATGDEGKRVIGDLRRASKQWQAEQDAKKKHAAFQASIADLVSFAERDYQSVLGNSENTVEECEQAGARLAAAKSGDRETYKHMHAEWRNKVLQRVAERAASVESERQTLATTRDAILAEQLDAPPADVPPVATASSGVPIDRSKRAITKKVQTEHGVREITEIVDA